MRDGDKIVPTKKFLLESVENSSLYIIPWSSMDLDFAISLFDSTHLDYKPAKFQIQGTSGYWEQQGNGFHGVRTKRSDFTVNCKWYYHDPRMRWDKPVF